MKQKRPELTLRLTPEEYERFVEILHQRGRMKQQAALLEAVRAWMKVPIPAKKGIQNDKTVLPYKVETRWRKYFDKLARILGSGNKRAISAVTENIDVFEDYVRIQAHETKEQPEEGGPEGCR